MSWVTLSIDLWTSFFVSASISVAVALPESLWQRSRKRRMPPMPSVFHGFTASSGPMNIS